MVTDPVKVFSYDDYRSFLKDKFEARKRIAHFFSHRYFARLAGMQTSNFLYLVIRGKRNLTHESAQAFARAFGLSEKETEYFVSLVLFNQARTNREKQDFYEKLIKLKDSATGKGLEEKQYEYFSKWYLPVIREMVDLPGFRPSAQWISRRLRFELSAKEINQALKLLLDLGMIHKTPEGKFEQTASYVTTGPEVASLQLASYHKQLIPLASRAVDEINPQEREISSLTATVGKDGLKKIKERIQAFQQELIRMLREESNPSEVIQINFQAFPFTKPESTETKSNSNHE